MLGARQGARLRARMGCVSCGCRASSKLTAPCPERRYDDALLALIEPYVYEFVSEHAGSISAEHGIGLMKAGALSFSKGPVEVELMRRIKTLVDPHGILNPYKTLPAA